MSCAAFNPTARQFCVACGTRFPIKDKSRDRNGRKRSSMGANVAAGPAGAAAAGIKTCPACDSPNPLSRLSCGFCGAKFSVSQTAALLQQSRDGDAPPLGGTRSAELDNPELALGMSPAAVGDGVDVSSETFNTLPLDAQMQVVQEKQAHRLLAQTLHTQMLEELHKNRARLSQRAACASSLASLRASQRPTRAAPAAHH